MKNSFFKENPWSNLLILINNFILCTTTLFKIEKTYSSLFFFKCTSWNYPFLFFSPPSFFSPSRGENGKIFKELYILFILSLLPHIFLVFLTKEGGEMEKMFSVFLIFTFFSPPTIYFLFFFPPPEPGIPCRIYTPDYNIYFLFQELPIHPC